MFSHFDGKGIFHAYFVRAFLCSFLLLLTCICGNEKSIGIKLYKFNFYQKNIKKFKIVENNYGLIA